MEQGYLAETDYSYWYNANFFQQFKLAYQKGELNYNENGKLNYSEQKIIIPTTSIFWQDNLTIGTILQSGFDINNGINFIKAEGVFYKDNYPWNILLRGGLLSNSTPLNHHYYLGGTGELPLRAEMKDKKAITYLLGSAEYRFKTAWPLNPIIFTDAAVYKKDVSEDYDKIINIGIGLSYNTPIGVPLRFDYGYNPETSNSSFRIGFGHSIWFNRIN